MSSDTVASFSPPFRWKGDTDYRGVVFAGPDYVRASVSAMGLDGLWRPFATVRLDQFGNTLVQLDTWRCHVTRFVVTDPYPAWLNQRGAAGSGEHIRRMYHSGWAISVDTSNGVGMTWRDPSHAVPFTVVDGRVELNADLVSSEVLRAVQEWTAAR